MLFEARYWGIIEVKKILNILVVNAPSHIIRNRIIVNSDWSNNVCFLELYSCVKKSRKNFTSDGSMTNVN